MLHPGKLRLDEMWLELTIMNNSSYILKEHYWKVSKEQFTIYCLNKIGDCCEWGTSLC